MICWLFRMQALLFLLYGLASGAAFCFVLEHTKNEGRGEGMAAMLTSMPMAALSEVEL